MLHWDKTLVTTELKDEGRVTYVFGADARMVLEAHVESKLLLPHRGAESRPVPLSFVANEPAVVAAMRDATEVASRLAARYVALTNGHQWILGLTFVPGCALEDRPVFIFESLAFITARFPPFWNCFSPTGIWGDIPNALLKEYTPATQGGRAEGKAQDVDANTRTRKGKRGRGRPKLPKEEEEKCRTWDKAWQSGAFKTYADCASAFGVNVTAQDIANAVTWCGKNPPGRKSSAG